MAYPIRVTLGPDGRRLYYIEDTASSAEIGLIEKVEQFDQIQPIGGGELLRLQAASDALYDASVQRLERRRQVQNKFKCQVTPLRHVVVSGDGGRRSSPSVGDRIDIEFRSDYEAGTDVLLPFSLSGRYWVMSVEEDWTDERVSTNLEISDIDIMEQDAKELVLSTIEKVNRKSFTPSVASSVSRFIVYGDIDLSHSFTVPITISRAVRELQLVDIRITPGPLRSTNYGRVFSVFEDDETPHGIRLTLNGVDRTLELTGNSVANTAGGVSVIDVDGDVLTGFIREAGTIGRHALVISCNSGRGRVRVEVEVFQSVGSVEA